MKNWFLLIVLVFLLFNACVVNKPNTISDTKAEYGTLRLVGDPTGRVATLDGDAISFDSEETVNEFDLKCGVYFLQISSVEKVLQSQKLIIIDSQTTEVLMP